MTAEYKTTGSLQQIEDLKLQVTDLKTALLDSEEKFRALTDAAPVGIFLDDAEGNAIYINQKCAELIGAPAEDALNWDWALILHPDDRELVCTEWKKAFEDNAEFHLEYRYVHPDGKVVWTLGEVIPVLGDDGKATLFIGTLTDITARKEMEIEKERLQAQLVQAQKMETVGRLAGGVAHDYNNMTNVILGYADLAMANVDATSPQHKYLQEILNAANRSAEVTRQLLSFARKQVVSPTRFDMNESVKDMFTMLRRLIGGSIELDWSPQTGPIPIKMDPSQFDQMVVNLCVNARDAIGGVGTIKLETATLVSDEAFRAEHVEAPDGELALLTVGDSGIGMDKETLINIFEPFFSTKDEHGGTGLGLASVYGTVKQSDGFIDVQSKPGAGTTFKIYLPLHNGPRPADQAPGRAPDPENGGETVLIVEDEAQILAILEIFLEDLGYTVLAAGTPGQALQLSLDHPGEIDLLITDVVMPEINGRELATRLATKRPKMKCLFMSGYTADIIADQGVLEENRNFIQKPFRTEELQAKVQEVLAKK